LEDFGAALLVNWKLLVHFAEQTAMPPILHLKKRERECGSSCLLDFWNDYCNCGDMMLTLNFEE